MTATSGIDVAALQRHTVGVLVASQALGGLGVTVGVAVAAVLAEDVSGRESLAGLVQTMQVLGAALASYVLARIMGARGRRVGLVAGFLAGATGAAVCVAGGALRSFPLLLLGALLLGSNSAANYQSRYAAADLAEPRHRARALATVLWATTLGAVLGPNLVGVSGGMAERVGLPRLTGPFLISVVVVLAAATLLATRLRPDPLLVARAVAREASGMAAGESTARRHRTSLARVRHLARERPAIGAAVLAISASHAVMVAVMVMTPLHMHHGGAELQIIGFVISVHVLGMFAFSPVVGILTDRLGAPQVLLGGAVVLWVALGLAGLSREGASWQIGLGLLLLGLGWSCATVAGSALLTEATPLEDRTGVQGAADLVMNVAAAVSGALGGLVVDVAGFSALAGFAALIVTGVLFAALAARRPAPAAVG